MPATAINYADFAKPEKEWSREQRIEWALAKFGDTAQYFWAVYRYDATGFRSKCCDIAGLDFDETTFGQQWGHGKFNRELRVRGNSKIGTIVYEDFGIATPPAAAAPSVDRFAALEMKLDALARGMGAQSGLAGVSVGGVNVRDLIEVAKALQPPPAPQPQPVMGMIEQLLAVQKLARQLNGPRRDDRDDDGEEGGGMMRTIIDGLGRMLTAQPGQAQPAAQPAQATQAPAPVASGGEPFPGAATIADAIPGLVAMLPPVVGRDGLPPETLAGLSDAVADAIEEGLGSPLKIAERFQTGAAIVAALIRYRPSLAPHEAVMRYAADAFVADQLAPDDDEGAQQ